MMSEIFRNILLVGSGSFLGGAARYAVSLLMKDMSKGFPWATLAANLFGCFLIGMLWASLGRSTAASSNWTLFLMTGFCGGFTTFSTFSKEALLMLQLGNYWNFALYVALSIVAGIALVALGYSLFRVQ
ncbi:MAG: fluoride efflux transporter CrcB [Candidatus Cryptobacteroides sp.]